MTDDNDWDEMTDEMRGKETNTSGDARTTTHKGLETQPGTWVFFPPSFFNTALMFIYN
jgi:hypothetical protein